MKGRKIGMLERHVEKVFLLVFVLAFLGVVARQFVGGAATVKVGQRSGLALDTAYDEISKRAEEIRGRIESNAVDENAPKELPKVVDDVRAALDKPRAAASPLAGVFGMPDGGGTEFTHTSGGEAAGQFAMPAFAAPSAPLARVFAGAIDPVEAQRVEGLAALLPDAQPYDKRFATVLATFDAAALRESLQQDPDGAGPLQAIPRHWWQGTLALLDVQLWRETLGEDGSWGDEQLIPAPPGFVSLRSVIDGGGVNLPALLDQANQSQRDIARPDFYAIISGPQWAPPAPPTEMMPEEREQRAKLEELRKVRRLISEAEADLERLQNEGRTPANTPGQRRGQAAVPDGALAGSVPASASRGGSSGRASGSLYARGPGGGAPPRRGGSDRRSAEDLAAERKQKSMEAIQTRINNLRAQEAPLVKWFSDKGLNPDEITEVDPGSRLLALPVGSLRESDSLVVWAHDLTVEPGATYRYRMRLVAGNPFFGRERALAEELQKALAARPVMESEPSAWSEPVSVDSDAYMFVTAASQTVDPLNGYESVRANVELYRFYYGFWRQASLRVEPGDMIAGEVTLPETLRVFEIDPERGAEGVRAVPMDGPVRFTTPAVLLDVRPGALLKRSGAAGGLREAPFEAVIRDEAGRIAVHSPEEDRVSDRRSRLAESAAAGETALLAVPGKGGVAAQATERAREAKPQDERQGGGRADR